MSSQSVASLTREKVHPTDERTLQQSLSYVKSNFLKPSKSFGARLLDARLNYAARAGRVVGQTELAGKVGVTPQAWSGWERGKSEPPLETIIIVARLLGVDPGWLAFGDNQPEKLSKDPHFHKVEASKQPKRKSS